MWSAGSPGCCRRSCERQITRGGPVIMVQVENEYGSYGSRPGLSAPSRGPAARLRGDASRCSPPTGPRTTCSPAARCPGVLATANFGSGAREAFATLRRHRPAGTADVHGVLVRLVRPLGRRPCRTGPGGRGGGAAGDPGVRAPRSMCTWRTAGRTSRAGRGPTGRRRAARRGAGAGRDVVRLRRADRRVRAADGEVLAVPGRARARIADGPLPELPPAPAALGAPVRVELTELGAARRRTGGARRRRSRRRPCRPRSRSWAWTAVWSATRSACRARGSRIR